MSFKILAVGEVLWDLLPAGRQLGGAPANYACHARSLGADATLISRVGIDDLGCEVLERLDERGMPIETIQQDPQAPTGTVDVDLGADGQPRYTIREGVAWDRIEADAEALAEAEAADAVCFGSLAQRDPIARRAIRAIVAAARPETVRVFDVNLRPPFWSPDVLEWSLRAADVLKLNDQELPAIAGLFGLEGDDRQRVAALADRFGLRLVGLTRGSAGSLLYAGGEWSDHPGLKVAVRDAVGAGDAFAATLTIGLLRGRPLDEINRLANEVAAYVCTQEGAAPPLPDRLGAAVEEGEGQVS